MNIKERNEAFLTFDRQKISAFCLKNKITMPEEGRVFWAGVALSVLQMRDATSYAKDRAKHILAFCTK